MTNITLELLLFTVFLVNFGAIFSTNIYSKSVK